MTPFSQILLGLLFFACVITDTAQAQSEAVSIHMKGKVLRPDSSALAFATVHLLHTPSGDTNSISLYITTNKSGEYELTVSRPGSSQVTVSMLGYQTGKHGPVLSEAGNSHIILPTIILQPDVKILNEVRVLSRKPFIEFNEDKIVVTVENRAVLLGTTGVEMLGKLPGILLYKNNILLNGKGDVTVLFDGRKLFTSSQEAIAYLLALPSDNIRKVEIIHSPGASYDASGVGGVINILLKKSEADGWNMTFSSGYSVGQFPRFNETIGFNFRKSQINIFGSYTYAHARVLEAANNRQDATLGTNSYIQQIQTVSAVRTNTHFMRFGIDYVIKPGHIAGFIYSQSLSSGYGISDIHIARRVKDAITDSLILQQTRRNDQGNTRSLNMNYKAKLDSLGRELNVDVNFIRTQSDPNSSFLQTLRPDVPGGPEKTVLLEGHLPALVHLFNMRADIIYPVKGGGRFEWGLKTNYSRTFNDARYDSIFAAGVSSSDRLRTTRSSYKEWIQAGYITFSKQYKKWSTTYGLRAEYTTGRINFITSGVFVNVNDIGLFPSFSVSYKKNKSNQFTLSGRRGTFRPPYYVMNPTIQFFDNYTFFQGNPDLKLNRYYDLTFSYLYKGRYNVNVGYSYIKDGVSQIYEQIPGSSIVKLTFGNIASTEGYSLSFFIPVTITKWWECTNNYLFYYLRYINYNRETFPDISRGNLTIRLSSDHDFKLPKNYLLSVSAYYSSPTRYNQTFIKDYLTVDAGIRKSFFKNKLSVFIGVADIPNTVERRGESSFNNIVSSSYEKDDTRRFRTTVSYRFGNLKLKANRQRRTGTEDEQGRMKLEQGRSVKQ